ncbi:family 16 glycosylhydrolase [Belliella pelovolcani]|uniref:glycoside hydrolase family 16 protein n=1 Tax=Belliella pelovolcani TaxID=529505 RepID=UPI00391D8BC6
MLQYYRLLLLLWLPMMMNSCKARQLPSWTLVWSDEFDYKGLPDPEKWAYEIGHIRNFEKQYYTGPRLENAKVRKGKLFITGKKERFPNAEYEEGSTNWRKSKPFAEYTSSCITTDGINAWLYGRIEVRAKLPKGNGIWPAIWMLGDNFGDIGWPYSGEIDIMEHIGTDPLAVHGTVHYPVGEDEDYKSDGGEVTKKRLSKRFHTYAIEWTEERIDFYIDDIKYHSFDIDKAGEGPDNPFRKPHFLLINLAMGAKWPGPIDDQVLPQQFIIDYVRVYQKN